jgi:hypothetical protein
MYAYCVGHFHLSESAAYKRIHAARLMRRFPAVHDALAEGRVHLSGLVLLVPYLKQENVDELLAAATHLSRAQIERMLAARFPKADMPTLVTEVQTAPATEAIQLSPGRVSDIGLTESSSMLSAPESATESAIGPDAPVLPVAVQPAVRATDDRARVKPLSAKRFAVQFTVDESTHELLRHAQELLGQRVAPGDVADVFTRALKAYVALLERAKFAATDQPQARSRRMAADSRHIPARMKRAVWARDGGQCTFVSDAGLRCDARASLEFDHVKEFARGGEATVDNIQLRCRGHNQHTAERTFGAEFMRQKRAEAAEARARAKAARERARADWAQSTDQLHGHSLQADT